MKTNYHSQSTLEMQSTPRSAEMLVVRIQGGINWLLLPFVAVAITAIAITALVTGCGVQGEEDD